MKQDKVLKLLVLHKQELGSLGILSLALFGSVIHGESGSDSDVDILVEFSKPVGFFAFFEVKERLEEILDCRVDLVTREALHPRLRDGILKEAVHAC
ncbi:nucleotidyltransferase family protein [Candidatus Bipolaricaulota bacterium]|nr:nucleotidyltransferase family protein [Candidatus Bipolaricaulota bacterium]